MNTLYNVGRLEHGYGGLPVLNLDPFVIHKGNVHALIGPNGAGKSTLLNLLAFLEIPDKGEIIYGGEKIDVNSLANLRKHIGYVQQNSYLFNLSVFDNIQLGLKLRGINKQSRLSRTRNIINQFEIGNLCNKKPYQLSGGEAQKVVIARTLILEPDVLIFDEPFTFLDKEFSLKLENIITKIRKAKTQTIIFSIHDFLRAQRLADQVWTLTDDKLVAEAPVNIFHGTMHKEQNVFDTGKLKIMVPDDFEDCDSIAIEAIHVVISKSGIHSSMRNSIEGQIKSIEQYDHNLIVRVEAGEIFTATITSSAQEELNLKEGDKIWVSFKSTAIRVIR